MTKETLTKFFEAVKKYDWVSNFPEEEEEGIKVFVIDEDYEYGYDDYYCLYNNPKTFAKEFIKDFKKDYKINNEEEMDYIKEVAITGEYDDADNILTTKDFE